MSQPKFARLVGIAESTLAKIESKHLLLSKENAIQISSQTGVSMGWLMEGDPLAPPVADESRFARHGGEPIQFTRDLFEQCRIQIEIGDSPEIDVVAQLPLLELPAMAASVKTLGQQRMFSYKVKKAFKDLATEFPVNQAELTRRERELFARRALEYELVKSQGALSRTMKEPVNKGIADLLQRLLDYGVTLGHIHEDQRVNRGRGLTKSILPTSTSAVVS